MDADQHKALRAPFPAEVVGKLPRGNVMLDFVGHATTTDRLLSVDPEWTWEPFALDEFGLPAYDSKGGLWIRLTIAGVTRPGYGDGATPKERIGDAIRNAAMRFGVALDLWAKDGLESELDAAKQAPPGPDDDAREAGYNDERERRAVHDTIKQAVAALDADGKKDFAEWKKAAIGGASAPYSYADSVSVRDWLTKRADAETPAYAPDEEPF